MTITSNPPGALVYANGVYKGRTPCTFEFLWYGDYDFELKLEGYETMKTHRRVAAPAHEWLIVDVAKEAFPTTYRDDKKLHFRMQPAHVVSDAELIQRGDAMRDETMHTGN